MAKIEGVDVELIKRQNQVKMLVDEDVMQAVLLVLGAVRGNSDVGRRCHMLYMPLYNAGVEATKDERERIHFQTDQTRRMIDVFFEPYKNDK